MARPVGFHLQGFQLHVHCVTAAAVGTAFDFMRVRGRGFAKKKNSSGAGRENNREQPGVPCDAVVGESRPH